MNNGGHSDHNFDETNVFGSAAIVLKREHNLKCTKSYRNAI